MLFKTHFRHICTKCGHERPAGTIMERRTITKDGQYRHEFTCSKCPESGRKQKKEFELKSLRGMWFYR